MTINSFQRTMSLFCDASVHMKPNDAGEHGQIARGFPVAIHLSSSWP